MSSGIAPVSYRRLLTTISQDLRKDQWQKSSSNRSHTGKMKDIQSPVVDLENYLVEHSYEYASSKTNFLDLLDDETLLQLAYEFGLDKKSDLPELQDIEITIGDCDGINEGIWGTATIDAEKVVQR
eukprot:gene13296-4138_t